MRKQEIWDKRNLTIVNDMLESVWNGRESSTVRKYCLSIRGFISYSVEKRFDISLPLSSTNAAEYLTYLKLNNKTKGAINTALAALKWVHSFMAGINKTNNPMDDEFLSKIASDARRHLSQETFKKRPISGDMIKSMCLKSNLNDLLELRNCLIVSLAYSLLLRNDEISHITCNHITELEEGYKIFIPKSKTDKYRNGKHVFLARSAREHSTASLFKSYMDNSGLSIGDNHFLFCPLKRQKENYFLQNSILAYSSYRDLTKKLLEKINLNPRDFGTHSCRAEGATGLAPHVTEHDLMVSGRWADPRSIRNYVELSDKNRFKMNSILQDGP